MYFCTMGKYTFAGHETFHCRNYWLKKGLDHIWDNNRFNDEAVIHLGVGKNMVTSIRFWLKAFGLIDKDKPNKLAKFIFEDDGADPFLEDIGSVWLLHHLLVTNKHSTIYFLVFSEFRKKRIEFTREHLLKFLEQKCNAQQIHYHQKSLKKDIGVFINNYVKPSKSKSVEEDFSGLLFELNLLQRLEKYGKSQWYAIENKTRSELPFEIVLFCILHRYGNGTVSFNELLNDPDSVGSTFALSSNGLMNKIEEILKAYPNEIVFSDDGGIRVLQFKKVFDKWTVLRNYYEQ